MNTSYARTINTQIDNEISHTRDLRDNLTNVLQAHIAVLEYALVQYFAECESGKVATMLAPQDRLRQLIHMATRTHLSDPVLFSTELLESRNTEAALEKANQVQAPPRTCPMCDASVYDRADFDTPEFAKYTCNSEVTVDPFSSAGKFQRGDKCSTKQYASTMPPDKLPLDENGVILAQEQQPAKLQCPNCHRGISDSSPLRYSCGTTIYAPVASQTLECKAWQERLINTPSKCRTEYVFTEGDSSSRICILAVSEDNARHRATVSLMAGRDADLLISSDGGSLSLRSRDEATKMYRSIRESLKLVEAG